MTYQSYETIERNMGGRPIKFSDPVLLAQQIEDYFNQCDEGKEIEVLSKRGELVKYKRQRPYSLEGLADFLDCCPDTLRNYAKKDGFFEIISRARNKIHMQWVEKGLLGDYNPKVAALCLAANTKTYNVVKKSESSDTLTIEQRLRKAKEIEHVQEAEIIKGITDETT